MNALATIHIGKKALGLDDDAYRDLLERETGKRSAKGLSETERGRVIDAMRRAGFKPASKGLRNGLEGRFAKKLQALWIAGWNLGLVRDRRDSALTSFVKRQTGLDAVRFCHDAADARKAVEALKAWLARDGGVMFGNTNGQEWLAGDGGKIAWAQWQKLTPGAELYPDQKGFEPSVFELVGDRTFQGGLISLSPADWRLVMNAFGERIRATT
ncbi:regulatory protein GemA [Notoacmeibacter ruber]|uniref:Regulatory protein GemA n=1 Tax=Notoacmeibacter ruber TaxID=2670375 RepID=A0A3L7JEK9_9HYPH|nr:regulatory protein GemA [Notoacmeibacter ruber]RLQ88894.1 regulatory protein GemA [Notoacmeibacter ruber]